MRAISIAGFLLMVGAIVGLLLGHALLSRSPAVIGVQSMAVALMLWARITLGRRSFHAAADPTEGGLVMEGPYHFVRHPIYTAVCLFGWASVLAHMSPLSAIAGGLVTVGALVRMLAEERLLVRHFPGYRQYAEVTKRMVPYLF